MSIEVTPTHGGVSRRRVIQGAAWATPAILIATAAPALAASTDRPTVASTLTVTYQGSGNSQYTITRYVVSLTVPPSGTFITAGTVSITVPSRVAAPATKFKDIKEQPADWAAPIPTGNMITFVRSSTGRLIPPQQLVFEVRWENVPSGTVNATFAGTSGGGPVASSASKAYTAP